jgi:hypothetical protein
MGDDWATKPEIASRMTSGEEGEGSFEEGGKRRKPASLLMFRI